MVIRFAPNKNNNQKAAEEQAVWRGTNWYVKIPLINLKVSASDGVSRLGHGLETRFFESRSRSPMSQVSSRSRRISVSNSRLCMVFCLWSLARSGCL